MRVLIADDDGATRAVLEALLTEAGYRVTAVADGARAWDELRAPDGPSPAVLDWVMPGLDGAEVCRRVRSLGRERPPYLLLLTARTEKAEIVAGLEAGANDYLVKPYHPAELIARVAVGRRLVELQTQLAAKAAALQTALDQVHTLQGILPICCHCKKIRDDNDYWQRVEDYISRHSGARFTHGICPECLERHYAEWGNLRGVGRRAEDEKGGG